jgi:hypothetical protein
VNFLDAPAVTRSDAHFIGFDGSRNGLRLIVSGTGGEENCDCEDSAESIRPPETAFYKFQHAPSVSPCETADNGRSARGRGIIGISKWKPQMDADKRR